MLTAHHPKSPLSRRKAPYSDRLHNMVPKIKCAFCKELAVAFRLEKDGAKMPLCAYHIPTKDVDAPPGTGDGDKTNGRRDERI